MLAPVAELNVLVQLFVNGISAASTYALLGLGWGVIFGTTRVFHIAHGITYALGAYGLGALYGTLGIPLLPASVLAISICGLVGAAFELLLYRPLRTRGASPRVIFVASLGALTTLTAMIVITFGPRLVVLTGIPISILRLGPATATSLQLAAAVVSLVTVLAFFAYWQWTWGGRVLRAVTSNPMRATVAGMSAGRAYVQAMVIGSALAGLAGVLVELSEAASPGMILDGALIASAAVLVGGFGSIVGAALGGALLAMAMNLGIWLIDTKWQYPIAFGVLLTFIVLRPRGLLGEKLKKAEI